MLGTRAVCGTWGNVMKRMFSVSPSAVAFPVSKLDVRFAAAASYKLSSSACHRSLASFQPDKLPRSLSSLANVGGARWGGSAPQSAQHTGKGSYLLQTVSGRRWMCSKETPDSSWWQENARHMPYRNRSNDRNFQIPSSNPQEGEHFGARSEAEQNFFEQPGLMVSVGKEGFDVAYKKLSRMVQNEGILRKTREAEYHQKPSEIKRRAKQVGEYRRWKRKMKWMVNAALSMKERGF